MQTLKKRVGGVVVIQSALKTLATPIITLTFTVDPEASFYKKIKEAKIMEQKGVSHHRQKIPHFYDCCNVITENYWLWAN